MNGLKVILILLPILFSCTNRPKKNQLNYCSKEAQDYIRSHHGRQLLQATHPFVKDKFYEIRRDIQECYEIFANRTLEDFNSCLVVGMDSLGNVEFLDVGTEKLEENHTYANCVKEAVSKIPFGEFGDNYVLIQTYRFYY